MKNKVNYLFVVVLTLLLMFLSTILFTTSNNNVNAASGTYEFILSSDGVDSCTGSWKDSVVPSTVYSGDVITFKYAAVDFSYTCYAYNGSYDDGDKNSTCSQGYEFSFNIDGEATVVTKPSNYEYEIYIIYKNKKFHVTYAAGTTDTVSNMPTDSTDYLFTDTVTVSSTIPTREGYTFDKWQLSGNGTGTYSGGSTFEIGLDATLTAKWIKNSNVTYEAGTTDTVTNIPADNNDYPNNEYVTVSSTVPTREGYTFDKWQMSGTTDYYNAGETFKITKDSTLIAIWYKNHYCDDGCFGKRITFDGFLEGNYYLDEDIVLTGSLSIKDETSAKICLNGHTLKLNEFMITVGTGASLTICDCCSDSRDFGQGTEKVTITGGCIYGAYSNSTSGCIKNDGILTVKNVDFVNNHNYVAAYGLDPASGDSVITNKKTANFYNCTFINNDAASGGAINNSYYVLLYNCILKNNYAEDGGAIKMNNEKSSTILIDTEIKNNYALTKGGAIVISDSNCFAKGTKITMKDGTTKNIEEIQLNDEIKTFDHITGQLSSEKVCLVYIGPDKSSSLTLTFENNTIDIVGEHDFLEQSSLKYVKINKNNVSDYVNKYFYNASTNSFEKLLSYQLNNNSVEYYSIYSANHLNCIANNMLTVCDDVDYLLNIYELNSSLKADSDKLNADIEKYGLLSFEDSKCLDRDWYDNFNTEYAYIAVGKGLFDLDYGVKLLINNNKIIDAKSFYTFNLTDSNKTGYIVIGDNVKIQNNYLAESRTSQNKTLNNIEIKKCDSKYGLIIVMEGAKNIDVGITKEDGGTFLENTIKIQTTPSTISTNQDKYVRYFSSDDKQYGVLVEKNTLDPVTYAYSLAPNCVVYGSNTTDETSNLPVTVQYNIGDTVTISSLSITRTGYKFKGWNTASDGTGTTYKANDTFTFATTTYLYAMWEEKKTINVTCVGTDINYGDIDVYFGETPVYTYSATDGLKDLKFKWNTDVDGVYTTTTPTTQGEHIGLIYRDEDDTYKAYNRTFRLYIGYKLTYDANGGTGTVPVDTAHYGLRNNEITSFKDPTDLSYTGYTFACWNTKADGTGTSYKVADQLIITKNSTFYAVWTPVIDTQPTSSNDYEVKLVDSTSTTNTYQWYKGTPQWVDAATCEDVKVNLGSISNGDFNSSAFFWFKGLTIEYSGLYTEPKLKFKSTVELDAYAEYCDADGYYTLDGEYTDGLYYYSLNNPVDFTLTNVEILTYEFNAISGETNEKLGTANEDAYYKCIITSASLGKINTDLIKTSKVEFDVNSGNGTTPTTMYQLAGRKITLPSDVLTKDSCYFAGYNTTNNATTVVASPYTVKGDTTLYAVYLDIITSQPNKDNDYSVLIDSSLTATYKWYKESSYATDTVYYCNYNNGRNVNAGEKIAVSASSYISVSSDIISIRFKYEGSGTITNITVAQDGYYYPSKNATTGYYDITITDKDDTSFITDVEVCKLEVVSDETTNKLSSSNLENTNYYCEVTLSTSETAISNAIKPDFAISFNGNDATSGTAPSTIYEFDGRSIALPTNTSLVKTNKVFNGWNNSSNATTALNNTYTPSCNITLYALWGDKVSIVIDENAQSYEYTSNNISFILKGTHKDLTDIVVSYKVNNVWVSNKPINVGSYDIKIERVEDNTYASYEKIISNGLIINKANAVINVDTTTITKTYGDTIDIPNATSNFGTVSCDKVVADLVNAGTYTVNYSVSDTDNYNGDSKSLTIVINKKEVNEPVISINSFTFDNTEKQVNISNVESFMSLVNTSITKATNVGTYNVSYTLDDNHKWANGSDGIISWSIVVASAVITVDTTPIVVKFGETVALPTATSTLGNVTCDKVVTDLVNPGVYTVTYSVDSTDNYNGDSKSLTVNIKQDKLIKKSEDTILDEVIVTPINGFDHTISLYVKTILAESVSSTTLTVDYSTLSQISKKEKVGVIYDIKLMNGNTVVSVPENETIKVKVLLPETLDVNKITKILHVHSDSSIDNIEFNIDNVSNGYYEFETNNFSEFAFICEADKTGLPWWAVILVILLSLIVIFVTVFVLWYLEIKKFTKDNLDINNRKLNVLDNIFNPVKDLLKKLNINLE